MAGTLRRLPLFARLSNEQFESVLVGEEVWLEPGEYLVREGDTPPGFFVQLEGKTQRQKNPHPKGSLAYAAWVCARLGGWTGYYGKPGPIVMLEGWLEFQALRRGANLLTQYLQPYQHDV